MRLTEWKQAASDLSLLESIDGQIRECMGRNSVKSFSTKIAPEKAMQDMQLCLELSDTYFKWLAAYQEHYVNAFSNSIKFDALVALFFEAFRLSQTFFKLSNARVALRLG